MSTAEMRSTPPPIHQPCTEAIVGVRQSATALIERCMRRLAPGGLLLFACNAQRFRLEPEVGQRWAVSDVSAQTLPFDFARNPRIHRCFEIKALP